MYYKCYFHPKADGGDLCRGCKLPICADCKHDLGFCPECMRKRDAVDDLRQLRHATAAKARVASSTTARLRLAIRQVGPIAKRGRLVDTTMLGTGRLAADAAWQREAMAAQAKVPTHFKEMMAQKKSQWTYDPDRVAYKGVKGQQAAQGRKAAIQRTSVNGRVVRSQAAAEPGASWAKPFFMGLVVGLIVLVFATFGQGLLKGAPKAKAKPMLSHDTTEAVALVKRATGTDEAADRARAKAAARKAVMAAAFAEASAAAARAQAATRAEDAARAQAYRAALIAQRNAATRAQAPAPVAVAPRPLPAHALPLPGASSRGVTARVPAVSSARAWRRSTGSSGGSGGMLVTSW